jgi:hypothetical protein
MKVVAVVLVVLHLRDLDHHWLVEVLVATMLHALWFLAVQVARHSWLQTITTTITTTTMTMMTTTLTISTTTMTKTMMTTSSLRIASM